MSRIGKKPVEIPEGVTIEISGQTVIAKGPKGELSEILREEIVARQENQQIVFEVKKETKESNALWGLSRALVANMIVGVTEGYEKKLELVGVGYRGSLSGNKLSMNLGYSHPIEFEAPEGIVLAMPDNKFIEISGIDKQLVGQVAAKIRSFRKPEPYKGKGIKYVDEIIKKKPGKAAKA